MIDGYTYDEEAQSVATFSENSVIGKGVILVISGSGNHIGRREEEIKRAVKIECYAKFDKIYKFLQSDEDNKLKYYESLSCGSYENLKRNEFLEVLVKPCFSKMRKFTRGFAKLSEMATVFEPIVAHLDENYFECNQDNFTGCETYMLCKVIRKVPKGEKIKLDEIFEDVKRMPLNRSQRRNMPKNIDNPAEFRD